MASNYTEASIKTLSSLEHIRLRPGMYIGRLGNGAHAEDGIYVLLKETIDNSIDEFMMGGGGERGVHRAGGQVEDEKAFGHRGPGCVNLQTPAENVRGNALKQSLNGPHAGRSGANNVMAIRRTCHAVRRAAHVGIGPVVRGGDAIPRAR